MRETLLFSHLLVQNTVTDIITDLQAAEHDKTARKVIILRDTGIRMVVFTREQRGTADAQKAEQAGVHIAR